MPSVTTCTIDRDQRDGLYELVRNHLQLGYDACEELLADLDPREAA